MSLHVGDHVVVNKDLHRAERGDNQFKLYASKGTVGKILEIFSVLQSRKGIRGTRTLHAKVLTEQGTVLTLRLTSLDRVILFDSLT